MTNLWLPEFAVTRANHTVSFATGISHRTCPPNAHHYLIQLRLFNTYISLGNRIPFRILFARLFCFHSVFFLLDRDLKET